MRHSYHVGLLRWGRVGLGVMLIGCGSAATDNSTGSDTPGAPGPSVAGNPDNGPEGSTLGIHAEDYPTVEYTRGSGEERLWVQVVLDTGDVRVNTGPSSSPTGRMLAISADELDRGRAIFTVDAIEAMEPPSPAAEPAEEGSGTTNPVDADEPDAEEEDLSDLSPGTIPQGGMKETAESPIVLLKLLLPERTDFVNLTFYEDAVPYPEAEAMLEYMRELGAQYSP